MSQEEKAKAYDEAIERAKKELNACGSQDCDAARQIFRLFPELAESEDERIRRVIIHELACLRAGELVGEEVSDRYKELSNAISWLEKQGEKKTADKVEPKFHEGDWVVQGCNILKIRCVGDERYCFETVGGYVDDILVSEIDSLYHLWSIQDAKEGDVLEFGDHGRLVVGIVSYVNRTTGKVDVYCLLEDNNFKVGNYYALDTIKPHPANKEQCDLLFQKMKEAGYEWYADKKELKKIEQKPAWSEEDEKISNAIYESIDFLVLKSFGLKEDEVCEWLKSLHAKMKQITEDYCNFETAVLLKENGFPQSEYANTLPYYTQNKNLYFGDINTVRQRFYNEAIAPSQSLALKWLREEYLYHIFAKPVQLKNRVDWRAYIIAEDCDTLPITIHGESPEQAVEAALKYTLENLI